MQIIDSIISQHAEEAAFLWLLRDAAVQAPHYTLNDLSTLDNRVEAHIDGLRIAGGEGWRFCAEGLQYKENGEVFTAAVMALESADTKHLEQVYTTIEAAPQTARGLVSALGWAPWYMARDTVVTLLNSASPFWRRIGIAACDVQRVDSGQYLAANVNDPDPELRARALGTVGKLARQDLLPALLQQLSSDDDSCRFWAAWSAVLLGDRREGLETLNAIALSASPYAQLAAQVVARVCSRAELQNLLTTLGQHPYRHHDLVGVCGAMGDPIYIPWLINVMNTPMLARVAGEAFSLITGVAIADEDLEGSWPEGFTAGPTENPADDDVAMDADEDLPWPDAVKVRDWWDVNGERFQTSTRYLLGLPVTKNYCHHVLVNGYQRQRIAAALELALMEPTVPLFETRAPGFRQRQWLQGMRA